MAVIENFIPRKDMKDMGNVQIYKLYGQNILRTKPYNPNTRAQKITRMRFKKIVLLIKQVFIFINTAYAGPRKGLHAHPHIISINKKQCFVENTIIIDPGLFVLCDNNGSFVGNVVLTSTVANTITGTFNSKAQNDEEAEDPLYAYGFDVVGNKIWHFDQSATRSSETITLTRPDISGLTIAIYFECLDRVNLLMNKPKHVIKYVGTVPVL
jgi:hypothetical protein